MSDAERASLSRRSLLAAGTFAGLALAVPRPSFGQGTRQGSEPMKIGVIGAGHIGSTVGALWVKSGHAVMFSSRHPEELASLVQELFLVLRRLWHDYDAERPLRPYLFGIAFRIASSHQRKYARVVKLGVVKVADPRPGPDDVLESNRARALVLEALEQVPLPRRAVLVLHELDQVSVAGVASMLSIPLFTVYSRLRKGRRELDRAIRRILRRGDAG
jgi:RNA polymerase sigma factor (sigma-70 family)